MQLCEARLIDKLDDSRARILFRIRISACFRLRHHFHVHRNLFRCETDAIGDRHLLQELLELFRRRVGTPLRLLLPDITAPDHFIQPLQVMLDEIVEVLRAVCFRIAVGEQIERGQPL